MGHFDAATVGVLAVTLLLFAVGLSAAMYVVGVARGRHLGPPEPEEDQTL